MTMAIFASAGFLIWLAIVAVTMVTLEPWETLSYAALCCLCMALTGSGFVIGVVIELFR